MSDDTFIAADERTIKPLPSPPAGYERVKSGPVKTGDLAFNSIDEQWEDAALVLGCDAATFYVARRVSDG